MSQNSMSISYAEGMVLAAVTKDRNTILDIGTGDGVSAYFPDQSHEKTFKAYGTRVRSVENNPKYTYHPRWKMINGGQYYSGHWYEMDWEDIRRADCVFIDHFPLVERVEAVEVFKGLGALTLVHDYTNPTIKDKLPRGGIEVCPPSPRGSYMGGILAYNME